MVLPCRMIGYNTLAPRNNQMVMPTLPNANWSTNLPNKFTGSSAAYSCRTVTTIIAKLA